MRAFRADLHIHTCLSPCADDGMVPREIAVRARKKALDIVGICDHNSAENVTVVQEAGAREGVKVLGGIEATSQEEVHILAVFDALESLFEFQAIVHGRLPGLNDEKRFGRQLVVDERGEVTGCSDRLLIGATSLSVQEIVERVCALGGLVIASHVDRESFSIISQLGFIPDGLELDALELSPNYARCADSGRLMKRPEEYGFPLVAFSDAHFVEDIGRRVTTFLMAEPAIAEMKKALSGECGRKVMFD